MSVEEIRNEIEVSLSGQVERICLKLLDELSNRAPEQNERLSFSTFALWADLKPSSEALHSALAALCQINHRPIEPYFIFLDVRDDREVELSVEYVKKALTENFFVNPETGNRLNNFQDFIVPMFRATNEFKEVIRAAR